jgi:DNA repair ATPase RecN
MPIDGTFLREYCGEEGMQLFSELLAFEARANEVIERSKQERIAVLESQHRELVLAHRKHIKHLDGLRGEEAQLHTCARSIDERWTAASRELRRMQAEKPMRSSPGDDIDWSQMGITNFNSSPGEKPNPMYSTPDELQEYERKLAAAQAKMDAIVAEQTVQHTKAYGWNAKWTEANQELARLNQRIEDTFYELQKLKDIPMTNAGMQSSAWARLSTAPWFSRGWR